MHKTRLFFLIILLEGYVVLACELIAMRQLIPFVGSGTEIASLIISAVLLPLAAGYHAGGYAYRNTDSLSKVRIPISARKMLLKNFLVALIIFTPGLSYPFLKIFFYQIHMLGINNRLLGTLLYCLIFLVPPIFLLGQTVPLVSNYMSKEKLSRITGRMLFFSTIGSFLGSVFSTIVLMSVIGVHNTVITTLGVLGILGLLLCRKKQDYIGFISLFVAGIIINSDFAMQQSHVVSDNAYSIIKVMENPEGKILNINHSVSSELVKGPEKYSGYVQYIDKIFIHSTAKIDGKILDILVIGAGGFTMGLDDRLNHYTFVDIDKDIKEVAEKKFLKQKLSPNKEFIAASARAYVHNSNKKFDLIILDVYTNKYSIPMECITRDFLQDIKLLLKENGIVAANIISSATFDDKFTVRYNNTFASVFPSYTRQIIDDFNPWDTSDHFRNILYIYYNNAFTHDRTIYTDDKNTYSSDMP